MSTISGPPGPGWRWSQTLGWYLVDATNRQYVFPNGQRVAIDSVGVQTPRHQAQFAPPGQIYGTPGFDALSSSHGPGPNYTYQSGAPQSHSASSFSPTLAGQIREGRSSSNQQYSSSVYGSRQQVDNPSSSHSSHSQQVYAGTTHGSASSRGSTSNSARSPPLIASSHDSVAQGFSSLSIGSDAASDNVRRTFVDHTDPQSRVRTIVRSGPSATTDPTLLEVGKRAHKHIPGTDNEAELLYPTFRKHPKPKKFFKVGRVFIVLWAEPAGDMGTASTLITDRVQTTAGRHGEQIYSKVRRFVVIRESDMYCSALSIMSYGNQGVGKKGAKKSEHGIVYTGREAPSASDAELPERGEIGMRPTAVRVDPDDRAEKLTPMSRLNYGKVYTVEHNVKVRSIGTINRDSHPAFLYQFKQVFMNTAPGLGGPLPSARDSQGSRKPAAGPSGQQPDRVAALNYLMQRGLPQSRAESILARYGTARPGEESGDETAEGDSSPGEENVGEELSNRRLEKTVRQMQKAGFPRDEAIAVIHQQRRRSAALSQPAEQEEEEEEQGSGEESEDDKARGIRPTQPMTQQALSGQQQRFVQAVQTLERRGVSREEAVRSVRQGFGRSNNPAQTSSGSKGKAPMRPQESDPEEGSDEDDDEGYDGRR